jgi:hypothetical protein
MPALLNWWWGCWIAGSLFSRLWVWWGGDQTPSATSLRHVLQQERIALYLHLLGSVVLIIAAVLAIVIVRRVSAMQDGSTEPQWEIAPQAIEPARAPVA